MTSFVVNAFGGMIPMMAARLIDARMATKAVNMNLTSGEAKPLRAPLKIGDELLTKAGIKKSIYRFGQDQPETSYWFHWTFDVDVVRGSIADDTSERTYFTGDGVPKYTYSPNAVTGGTDYPNASYALGVIKPDLQTLDIAISNRVITSITKTGTLASANSALPHKLITGGKVSIFGATDALYNGADKVATVVDADTFTYPLTAEPAADAAGTLSMNYGGLPETRLYAITYVSALGEEGAPAITALMDVIAGQIVTFTNLPTAPTGNYNYTKKRIYRTASGSQAATLRYVGEVSLAETTFIDDVLTSQLGENIPSLTYEAPPADLHHLIQFSNGMLAGLSGNQACVSVAYQPHAWPISGRYSFNVKPVALGSFGQSIVVLTEGTPIVLTGSSYEAMSEDKVKVGQPCVSARSVVELANGVMWSSNEGLAFISNQGFDMATKMRLTNREWAKYNPSSIRGYRWVNRYVGFYDNGEVQAGFVFDVATLDFFELDFYATAGYTDPKNGNLYLAIGDDVFKFDAGENLELEWISKVFESAKPINLAFAKVVAREYPVEFRLYADDVLKLNKNVLNNQSFSLPLGFKATSHKFAIKSEFDVLGVGVAESMDELRQAIE